MAQRFVDDPALAGEGGDRRRSGLAFFGREQDKTERHDKRADGISIRSGRRFDELEAVLFLKAGSSERDVTIAV